jgi:hypothetical protein
MISPDKKHTNHFRRIIHPRKKLSYSPEEHQFCMNKYGVCPNVSAEAVTMELLNYYDPYDTGIDIGQKEIRHSARCTILNAVFFSSWNKYNPTSDPYLNSINRSELNYRRNVVAETKLNTDKVYDHITKQKTIYGTMNPFSPIRVLGTDVDNNTDNPELVLPFLYLFQSFYPGSFYDGGSSGKSLHYFPKINMLPLYGYYCMNTDISCEWAEYANGIIKHTSRIFRIYSHNIHSPEHVLVSKISKSGRTIYKPEYHVHFDAFKSSYPEYEFYRDDDGTPHPTKMTQNGVLHKLPNIFTVEDLV